MGNFKNNIIKRQTKLLLLIIFISVKYGYSQSNFCGFDILQRINSVELKIKTNQINEIINNQIKLNRSQNNRSNNIATIPVVFHIMHQNGPENIPDSLIFKLINQLNLRYQNSAPYYDSTGTETGIQFCLASIDPLGNPTTGITRNVTTYTDVTWTGPFANEIAMKNISRWNPNLYLNVWVVRNILPGASGFSSYPSDVGQANDGVVIQYQNSTVGQPHLLSHEVGHYLGLYHTFEGSSNCINNNCLLDGDRVCDTPPDVSIFGACDSNSCSTEMNDTSGFNPFTSDVNDLPNYMDYTVCPLSFTQGQSARMNATLATVRNSLLLSNGCGSNPGGSIPVASFTHEMSCSGEKFINNSINSLSAEWDFDNDGMFDMIGDTVYHTYPSSGNYTIKMRVSGFGGGDSITQTSFIQVRLSPKYPILHQTGYSYSPYTAQNYSCVGNQITIYGFPSMASYLWSNGATTQNITFVADSSFDLSLTAVDQNGYTWTTCPEPIHVVVAPELIKPIIDSDKDSICISDSLHINALLGAGQYVYSWNNGTEIISNDTVFNTIASGLNNYVYLTIRDVNGCKISSDTLFIIADSSVAQPNILSHVGDTIFGNPACHNQFYKDGIPIANATGNQYLINQTGCYSVLSWYNYPNCAVMSDTICFTITGIIDSISNKNYIIYPNPAKEYLYIKGIVNNNTSFVLFNSFGQEVAKENLVPNSNVYRIKLKDLPAGIYFWKLNSNSKMISNGKVLIDR